MAAHPELTCYISRTSIMVEYTDDIQMKDAFNVANQMDLDPKIQGGYVVIMATHQCLYRYLLNLTCYVTKIIIV